MKQENPSKNSPYSVALSSVLPSVLPGHCLRIGTRGSALALYQANITKELLEKSCAKNGFPYTFKIVEIKTTGDKVLDRRLSDMGGKALFTKEIDHALLDGRIDLAVHSLKDCETWLPPAFEIAAILEREDTRDALISWNNTKLKDLQADALFGTCSLRRTSQLLHLYPHFKTTLFRGNIQTRLKKIHEHHEADITMLAIAGLSRMGLIDQITEVLEPDILTPCVGQGAIGIVCLKDKIKLKELLRTINHHKSYEAVTLERFFLDHIEGHCGTPVGGLVTFENSDRVNFIACVATPDGSSLWRENLSLSLNEAPGEIARLGREMKKWLQAYDL